MTKHVDPFQIGGTITIGSGGSVHRAYSILETKAIDDERRIISGVATTPEPDRLGDIVEPLGVKFRNPMPLLWQHDTDKPIGTVKFSRPTEDGIDFEARLPKIDEPGTLKDRVDEAWQSIKLGLVRAVSIGFRSLERSLMKDGGIRFIETEVMELSLVTIPANASATIQQIKSIDAELLAASGRGQESEGPPGVTGKSKTKSAPKDARKMSKHMTIAEQASAFEATRAAKAARMAELMSKAAEEGATLEEAESEEYDGLELDVKKVDEHLVRLRALDATNKAAAKPIEQPATIQQASESRSARVISVKANVPQGTAFTRYAMAIAGARGNRYEALQRAREDKTWHEQTPEVELCLSHDIPMMMRAAVAAGTTTDATWASPLVVATNMASEFIDLLRPATILGRVPGLRRVPFNISMPRATAGTSTGWVGEGAMKPVTNMAFDTVTLRWAKAASIVVLTDELVRFSNPSAEAVVRQDMIAAMAQFLDRQFVDPAIAAVANVSPASITNGVTPVTATGTTAAAFRADVKSLFNLLFAGNLSTVGGVWIMTQTQALALALMQNSLGQQVFPSITAEGGTLLGYPVITSENIPATGSSPVDGFPIIFLIAREIMLADDGQVVIDASNQASLQFDSAPDSPPTASTNLQSLWQANLTALKAERYITWLKRRSTVVQFIQNAKYAE